MCIKHTNFKFILQKIKAIKFTSITDLSQILCCKEERACMNRICIICKENNVCINSSLVGSNAPIFFYKWETRTEMRIIKSQEKQVKLTTKQKIPTTPCELIEAFLRKIPNILQHSYRVFHQISFGKLIKETMSSDEICIIIDFSENYDLKCAQETQSAHLFLE